MCIFFFTDTATTEIYTYFHTLSLHDALPIWIQGVRKRPEAAFDPPCAAMGRWQPGGLTEGLWRDVAAPRSEEHTSELQSLMRISYDVSCLKKTKHNHYVVCKLIVNNTCTTHILYIFLLHNTTSVSITI